MTNIQELESTRFFVPLLPSLLLARPRLIQRMDEHLPRKLTLISAPAGYGKTTLIREWIAHAKQSVAWFSLSEADNDPVRFWTSAIQSCQRTHPQSGQRALALLQSPDRPPLETVLASFINDLTLIAKPFTFVLDDYHHISEHTVHQTLRMLLDLQPPQFHLILATRIDPPLALSRRRAHRELLEIRTTDLRFMTEEIRTLFSQIFHSSLSVEEIASLETRTEGWIVALHLVALALQENPDLLQRIAHFSGVHRHIMDYLADEVFSLQPEATRTFLLRTALLDSLTGSLCDALTGYTNGQAMLEQLERANLFLVPLDEQRTWYRYHHLFADMLRTRALRELGSEELASCYRLASSWYEHHNLPFEAIETALAAADYGTAIRLGRVQVPTLLLQGRDYTLHRWLLQLPRPLVLSQPEVCIVLAWTLLLQRQFDAVQEPLLQAEHLLATSGNRSGLGHAAALRAVLARLRYDGDAALYWGQHALALLPEEALAPRSVSATALGLGYLLQGALVKARQTLIEARILSEQANNTKSFLGCTLLLGRVLALQGQLTQAAIYYQQVINAEKPWSVHVIEAHIMSGYLLLERNDLDEAQAQLDRALALSQQHEDLFVTAQCILLQARILHVRGEAEEAFLRAVILARQSHNASLVERVSTYQARWWLSQGNMAAVLQWRDTCTFTDTEVPLYEHEEQALTLVRVLLTQGETNLAESILDRWYDLAKKQERTASEIEILLLKALVRDAQRHLSEAVSLVHQAFLLAQSGQYCRIFVEEGREMLRLLQLLQPLLKGKAEMTYLEVLLKALSSTLSYRTSRLPLASNQPLPLFEPLSPRECTVLRLLAAGLSTREIASELVVSINTIKTQLKSAYRKLNASNRTEALSTARYWHIL